MKIETVLMWGVIGYIALVAIQSGGGTSGFQQTATGMVDNMGRQIFVGRDGTHFAWNGGNMILVDANLNELPDLLPESVALATW